MIVRPQKAIALKINNQVHLNGKLMGENLLSKLTGSLIRQISSGGALPRSKASIQMSDNRVFSFRRIIAGEPNRREFMKRMGKRIKTIAYHGIMYPIKLVLGNFVQES